MFTPNFEHPDSVYGYNIRGFKAYVPRPFGHNPAQMEKCYRMLYLSVPTLRSTITEATIAGAAAYKAVIESPGLLPIPINLHSQLNELISNVRAVAAQEAQILLQRYPLPGVDPAIVIRTAEEGAIRLYEHENFEILPQF